MDRHRALQELREAFQLADEQSDLAQLKALFYRIQGIAQQFPQDAEVQAEAGRARQAAVSRGKQIQEALARPAAPAALPTPPGGNKATNPAVGAPTPAAPAEPAAAPPAAAPPSAALPPGAPARPAAAPPRPPHPGETTGSRSINWLRWRLPVMLGAIVALLLAIPVMYYLSREPLGPPKTDTTAGVPVTIRTQPSGAQIRINGEAKGNSDLSVKLPVGEYLVEAVLDGYQPAASGLKVEFGKASDLGLTLSPMAPTVRILTDLEAGVVSVDGQPAKPLDAGQFVVDGLAQGKHNIRVTGAQGDATFAVEVAPGSLPKVTGPITARNVLAVAVANVGGKAMVYGSDPKAVPVSLDNKASGEATPQGLALDVTAGEHELTWSNGTNERKLLVSFGSAPMLTAFLKLDLNAGTLVITTGEDEAAVFVDGVEFKKKTSRGQLRIPNLPVKGYKVRVAKAGFKDAGEQVVQILKGQESRVGFQLKPLPKVASLQLAGALPGASVLIDGNVVGTVKPDGSLQVANLEPGERTVELRADRHVPRKVSIKFTAGQVAELRGGDVALELAKGTLRVNVSPANARLLIRKESDRIASAMTANPMLLAEGTYVVTGQLPDGAEKSITVAVDAGQSKVIELKLASDKPAPVVTAKTQAGGIEGFDGAGQFRREGDWYVRKGGGMVLYRSTPGGGVFSLAMFLKKGTGIFRTSRLQFVVDYDDPKNFVLYQIDAQRLTRIQVIDGRRVTQTVANKLGEMEYYSLQVEVKGESVSVRGRGKEGLIPLDSFTTAGRDATDGRFGLMIQGNDEFAVGDFRFTPR